MLKTIQIMAHLNELYIRTNLYSEIINICIKSHLNQPMFFKQKNIYLFIFSKNTHCIKNNFQHLL
jgi:hypothetical protein